MMTASFPDAFMLDGEVVVFAQWLSITVCQGAEAFACYQPEVGHSLRLLLCLEAVTPY